MKKYYETCVTAFNWSFDNDDYNEERFGRHNGNSFIDFHSFLNSLSAENLAILLDHSIKTTNIIKDSYLKKCASEIYVNESTR